MPKRPDIGCVNCMMAASDLRNFSIGTAPGTIYSTPILGKYRTKIVQQM